MISPEYLLYQQSYLEKMPNDNQRDFQHKKLQSSARKMNVINGNGGQGVQDEGDESEEWV